MLMGPLCLTFFPPRDLTQRASVSHASQGLGVRVQQRPSARARHELALPFELWRGDEHTLEALNVG